MPTRKVTVLVADDHAIVREGLVSLLKEHEFDIVGAVDDGRQLIETARVMRPDVIVTDLSMPGVGGLAALSVLKAERSDCKIIVLAMHNGESAAQVIRAGAAAFLLKASAGEELITAIEQVMQGRVYITPAARPRQ